MAVVGEFKFRRDDNIGAASAEDDADYLDHCYVDTGALKLLEDTRDRRVIVLGRTGSGKSALLHRVMDRVGTRAVSISPEGLALAHVSNSTILRFFADLGVNLDPFFKLLWRHVITVEILSHHLRSSEPSPRGMLDKLSNLFSRETREDREMRETLDYLNKWGSSFWQKTEFRVKEITQRLESDLEAEAGAAIGTSLGSAGAVVSAAEHLTDVQKGELITRAQTVVAETQIEDLHRVGVLLDRVLDDEQQKYFVLIDGLDVDWVEERLRYRLIMALLHVASEFIPVKNAKVVIALRRDLIERVFRLAREAGFQEEKFRSRYLLLGWSKDSLLQVLDTRVNALVSRRYTKGRVSFRDLLPKNYMGEATGDAIAKLVSTPRDVIALFNECITASTGQPKVRKDELRSALGEYSRSRLRALGDEWSADYPGLLDFARILERRPRTFPLSEITDKHLGDTVVELCSANPERNCLLYQYAMKVLDNVLSLTDFRFLLTQVFYNVGLVGLKLSGYEPTSWSGETGRSVSRAEVELSTTITVHPKYHRALGIGPNKPG
jgi:hypothetical protein